MGVVRRETAGRWATVVVGVAALAAIPPVLGAIPAHAPRFVDAATLRARALASDRVPHQGLVESTGGLGIPDLPQIGAVGELLGGTTRERVWWSGPGRWRVDRLTAGGEEGIYPTSYGTFLWDFERNRSTSVLGTPAVRLPRADDLVPPQAARRLLRGVGPGDKLTTIPARRVVGRTAAGLRITPGDARSSVAGVDVWVDVGTGLPLELRVRARGEDRPVLVSRFLGLQLTDPDPSVLRPPDAAGARRAATTTPDLASFVDSVSPWALPARLAGLPRTDDLPGVRGVATYGAGLARYVVLPLPGRVAGETLRRSRSSGATPFPARGGTALLVRGGVLGVVVAQGDDRDHAYLIAGTVTAAVLQRAATELLATPPGLR